MNDGGGDSSLTHGMIRGQWGIKRVESGQKWPLVWSGLQPKASGLVWSEREVARLSSLLVWSGLVKSGWQRMATLVWSSRV